LSAVCADPNCDRPCWASEKRGRLIVHSVYCKQHSHIALFDVSAASVPQPQPAPRDSVPGVGPHGEKIQYQLSQFHTGVRRQRLDRERQP
jgi:hypothetical protein